MGEEVELAAKGSAEVITALTEASGILGPPQEFWGAITSRIHYRFAPRVVRQAMTAAEAIDRLGLPRRAYVGLQDPLLRAILEGGSMADDEEMQARWANLLANALTESRVEVPVAFPRVLGELEPVEAATLDALFDQRTEETFRLGPFTLAECNGVAGIGLEGLDNLVRVGLLRATRAVPATWATLDETPSVETGVQLTDFGWTFVHACREPQPSDP